MNFIADVFLKLGLKPEDAQIAAVVLTDADVRGIPSHGVGRILRYINGVKSGMMLPQAEPTTIRDTRGSLLIDANGGMGHPVSYRTMRKVIEKAEVHGSAFATIRNSNHYGVAGYYAMMALDHDMIGISLTNAPALGVPTFGRDVMFGTNPIAFAAPADREKAFVLDMATTVIPRGKIELYDRKKQRLPLGWAVDKAGRPATDPHTLLDDLFHRRGGGILPLGGAGEEFGGHKGYGLAVMVDVICAVLAGGPFGSELSDTDTTRRVSQFFGAIKISLFREPTEFRADMDRMLANLRQCPPSEGEARVYFAGLKEFEKTEEAMKMGVPLPEESRQMLWRVAKELELTAPF